MVKRNCHKTALPALYVIISAKPIVAVKRKRFEENFSKKRVYNKSKTRSTPDTS